MNICVLAGGVGGARFLLGARRLLGLDAESARAGSPHRIDAVVNVGDDAWMHGVRICPDLDTCMYTLGGGIDPERGWGHAGETWNCRDELAAYGVQPDWFGLGDKDLATHLVRTQMLDAGYRLTDVTEALSTRWSPGVRLLPVTDDRCETHVVVTGGAANHRAGAGETATPGDGPDADAPGPRAIHFQEWWVKHRAQLPASGFVQVGADAATPTPETLEAIETADLVVVAPSNPVVSVGAILAVPGIRAALRSTPAPVVGISPVIGGAVLRGMADACLTAIGVETSATAVARHYGARSGTGLLDGWLVAPGDAPADGSGAVDGVTIREVPLLMTDPDATADMVAAAIDLAGLDVPARTDR
ncbi:2-phospho-L-lactate transferase [Dietzia kunjamensis]|uniref:2-phospho-L-lactate transferase CofD family protein n=1 Tax=Dietzia kunjamensis TaxID=322509 RepID=UPI002DBB64FE|nr:2-phospho-L-lactate transferase CofD family protein [Dietzia kunjamensis]MEB8326245.1 2-phospho-L-lactate transferase [Dietzia kunjamensis]